MQIRDSCNHGDTPRQFNPGRCSQYWRNEILEVRSKTKERRRLYFCIILNIYVLCIGKTCLLKALRLSGCRSGSQVALFCFRLCIDHRSTGSFFELIMSPLEKGWLKTSNIFLLGDFNCDLRSISTTKCDPTAFKLLHIFDALNLQNIVKEPTRETPSSSTLIELIVTTRKDLVSSVGTHPLGISDHNLIYSTIMLKNKRPPPKIICEKIQRGYSCSPLLRWVYFWRSWRSNVVLATTLFWYLWPARSMEGDQDQSIFCALDNKWHSFSNESKIQVV